MHDKHEVMGKERGQVEGPPISRTPINGDNPLGGV